MLLRSSTIFLLLTSNVLGDTLTLSDILVEVKQYSPVILAALQERETAKADLLSAEGSFDPTFRIDSNIDAKGYYDGRRTSTTIEQPTTLWGAKIFGGYALSRGDFPLYDGKMETGQDGEIIGGIEVPLLRDGPIDRRRANITKSELGQNIAEANITERYILLSRAAKNIYLDWVAAGQRKKIFKTLLDVANARTKQLSGRAKAGDIAEFDVTDNKRIELQREAQLISTERQLRQAALELSLYHRGKDGDSIVPVDSELPTSLAKVNSSDSINEQEFIEKAFKQRPEMQRIASQIDQNKIERDFQLNQQSTKLDLRLTASNDLGEGVQAKDETEIDVGIRIEIPLQTRTAHGRVKAAEAKIAELEKLNKFIVDRVRTDVKDSIVAVKLAKERHRAGTDELKAARKLEEGERTRFELGDSNLIFVNLREQTAAEAATRELDALLDYHKANAALKAALGEF